jgi:hypothetical protein
MKKHIWTSLALALGVISFVSGITQLNSGILVGPVIVLSAIACRSANKRRFSEVETTNKRMVVEFILIALMILSIALQSDLKTRIALDPVPNFIIPVICLIFYVISYIRAKNKKIEV